MNLRSYCGNRRLNCGAMSFSSTPESRTLVVLWTMSARFCCAAGAAPVSRADSESAAHAEPASAATTAATAAPNRYLVIRLPLLSLGRRAAKRSWRQLLYIILAQDP